MPREPLDQRIARLTPGANWLRAEREKRKWSQTELAHRLGLPEGGQERISAYERAQDEPQPAARREFAKNLADAFGINEVEVYDRLGWPRPSREAMIRWARDEWGDVMDEVLGKDPGPNPPEPGRKPGRRTRLSQDRPQEPERDENTG